MADEAKSMSELVEDFCSERKLRFEGEQGVRNLCILARAIGYRDRQYFGQFDGGCYGDLIAMLEDNQGMMEAILEWLGSHDIPEWMESLVSHLTEESTDV